MSIAQIGTHNGGSVSSDPYLKITRRGVSKKQDEEKVSEAGRKSIGSDESEPEELNSHTAIMLQPPSYNISGSGKVLDINSTSLPTGVLNEDIFKKIIDERPWFSRYYSVGVHHNIFKVDEYKSMTLDQIAFHIIAGSTSETRIASYVDPELKIIDGSVGVRNFSNEDV